MFCGAAEKEHLLERFFDCDGDSDCRADHGVIAHAEEAHHLDVRGNGGGTCELRIRVHTAHGVGHAVGSRACRHVVGVEGTAGAAAGCDGEVLLTLLDAFLLVGAGNFVTFPLRTKKICREKLCLSHPFY